MRLLLLSGLFFCVYAQDIQDRISIQKCREYGQNITKPCISGDDNGGFLAELKEFPHMALIGHGIQETEWICSGSLISDQYVLSAAHCAASVPLRGRPKLIRLGALNPSLPSPTTLDFNISEIILHPSYSPPSFYNDIVLFKLDRPVPFSDAIRPACLASGGGTPTQLTVSGWGEADGAAHQQMKRDRAIELVGVEQCGVVYEGVRNTGLMDEGVKGSQICGSPIKTEACHIRSGAPLQYSNRGVECMYDILGILSFGIEFCGSTPHIYTNVPEFLDWIENTVWPQA